MFGVFFEGRNTSRLQILYDRNGSYDTMVNYGEWVFYNWYDSKKESAKVMASYRIRK